MKRSFLLQTVCLTMAILWAGGIRSEDAPIQREDIGRALEMYRWLVDHEEFNAAGKLAAEMQAIHPDDPQVQLIVENAQLRAAVREANRVLVEDEPVAAADMAPPNQWEVIPPWEAFAPAAPDPFEPDINWRELGNIAGSAPVVESEIVQTSGVETDDAPPRLFDRFAEPRLFDSAIDRDRRREFRELQESDQFRVATEEARLHRALSRPISMHFNDAPLSDIARYISETCDVNVVIDEHALEEEGVSPDTTVTLAVDGVQARSALNLVLRSLHLDYTIEDEVIKITNRMQARGGLLTRVYAVPDLVTPIPHQTPGSVRDHMERLTESAAGEFDALVELIQNSVDPDSWSDVGGPGFVSRHESTLSLVVRQTQQAHDEIGDLLSQVRRLRDVRVSHNLRLLNVPVSQLDELGLADGQMVRILTADESPDHEKKYLGEESPFDVQALRGITLFNGQTGTVVDEGRTMLISSVASSDRRSVRVNVALPQTLDAGDVMSAVQTADVPDGGVGLILMSDAEHLLDDENYVEVLAIAARIQVVEEEEELLGLP